MMKLQNEPKKLTAVSYLLVALYGVFLISISSEAAVERLAAPLDKKNIYVQNGVFTGGEAGTVYSLLNVRRFYSAKDKLERIVFDLGDEKGQPLRGKVSYFQASLESKLNRVVIDLSQLRSSGISVARLQEVFRQSPFVKKVNLTFDPTDGGMTCTLDLKRSVKMEAFRLPSPEKASRIVIDLKDI